MSNSIGREQTNNQAGTGSTYQLRTNCFKEKFLHLSASSTGNHKLSNSACKTFHSQEFEAGGRQERGSRLKPRELRYEGGAATGHLGGGRRHGHGSGRCHDKEQADGAMHWNHRKMGGDFFLWGWGHWQILRDRGTTATLAGGRVQKIEVTSEVEKRDMGRWGTK
eukprot:749745-Hanusia_phi.AAC.1